MKRLEVSNQQFNIKESKVRIIFRALLCLIQSRWSKLWNGNPPGILLFLFSVVTGIIMAIPIIYVFWRSFFAGKERWLRLLDTRIPALLWNTVSLATMVTILSILIGVSLAWIVHRYEFAGCKMWQWLLALPLVIPPYVGAVTYIIILGPRGWARDLLGRSPINIYSFWGVVFVLTILCYPYVFLIVGAGLKKMNVNFEEAARSQGLTSFKTFWKVNLPLLRPAMGAGGILVFLYALPGVIVALGIIFVFNQYIPWLYNTYFLIAIAYVIRFLPQAMQSGQSALSLISPPIDEAARSLGYASWKVLFRVIIPLIMPGILARRPSVILLDEPFSNLDADLRSTMRV